MTESNFSKFGFDTTAVRGGHSRTAENEHSEPLYLTSSYVFENAQQGEDRMAKAQPGNVYSRYTNPTVGNFENRLARLEQAEDAVGTASGMAAILSVCMALLEQGDHLVCSRDVFGSTIVLFEKYIQKFGVDVTFVKSTDLDQWRDAITPNTKLFFLETPSNPLNEVTDLRALSKICNSRGIKLIVDNCLCTPALQQPLSLGADLVVHSATKYIDGQGRALGGVVAGNAEDIDSIRGFLRSGGPAMSPFNAWIFLKGLETLKIRMQAHSESALAMAKWLLNHRNVESVHYCGLPKNPGYSLAKRQQSNFGGVLSFKVVGGKKEAWQVIDATEIFSITPNLGDAKSTIVHPATTTHGRISDEQRIASGVTDNLIRLSMGFETLDDLFGDLDQGLSAI